MTVTDTAIHTESRDRYLTYALSVVSGRALPDVRDGLKPVQRRILYSMYHNLGLTPDKSHSKSASVVGDVLAKLHPHGDTACYEAMVRMAQDFSLRYPLVDGQGNFGSLDGDSPAAYRYTEAKLRALAMEVLGEIDQETVEFRDNFSSTLQEPTVLPSRVPNLLINGSSGIAVGMATSIPPHNLKDTIKALLELIQDPDLSNAKLSNIIKGPDFPTACSILNTRKELSDLYTSGRGSIRMRGDWKLEEAQRGKKLIVITSVPYAINKSQLVEKIADLIIQRKIPQLTDVRDESTEDVRVVMELAPGANPEMVLAYLYKNTTLESNFSVNLTALVPTENGAVKPELLSLKACLEHFLEFREEVTVNRLNFEKRKLLERIHILEGLATIYDHLDEAIKIIRKCSGRADSAEKLRVRFKLSEIQSFAVVDQRIYQLSKTSIEEIELELDEKSKRLKEINSILKDRKKLIAIIVQDLENISEKYGDKRKSSLITETTPEAEFKAEDYVVHEGVFAIITKDGWIKRIRQNNELAGTRLREGDSIFAALPVNTKESVIIFTSRGNIFSISANDFPASSGYGEPIQKTLRFGDGERVVACFSSNNIKVGSMLVLCSKEGVGYLLSVSELETLKRSGRRVMKLRGTDELAVAAPVPFVAKEVCLVTRLGYGLRIDFNEVLAREAPAVGVQLIGIKDGDQLVSALVVESKQDFLVTVASGKIKELGSKEIVKGTRALRGNKIFGKDEIVEIKVKEDQESKKQLSL